MTIFELTFSEAFLLEAHHRMHQCRTATKYATVLMFALAAIFVGLTVLALAKHVYGAATLGAAFSVLMWIAPRADEGSMRRRFKRISQYNQRIIIELLEGEVKSSSDRIKTQVHWTIFTKARRFDDGFLLFQGPLQWNWIPTGAIVAGSAEDAHQLIKAHVSDYKCI